MAKEERVEAWMKLGRTNASNFPLFSPLFVYWERAREGEGLLLDAKLHQHPGIISF